ncbi:TIM barrel protein [uncultured Muriicola sp.]|uniref:sugar phosphate isomerase/epimerase family protein n=1 Tax=uncultured Muriicola sp. TaxID=1583102 RepID=UPI00261CF8A7|nr:TIM barrel protein [uncultured Muriicola sp.]
MATKCQNLVYVLILICFTSIPNLNAQDLDRIAIENTYPWCIVAYDSLERSPKERIALIKEIGFNKYAYDWRDEHLDDTHTELKLATEHNIEIVSVWLWLNAKRDSLNSLSPANRRIMSIVESLNLKTTFWVSFSGNFFENLSQSASVDKATELVNFIATKANSIGCQVALYNHSGWFGDPMNQLEIIRALPDHDLGLVYNFHHAHQSIDDFPSITKAIAPYLVAVNLNGMQRNNKKILTLGKGEHEKRMIFELQKQGFNGPWGILGHVAESDVEKILRANLEGLMLLQK